MGKKSELSVEQRTRLAVRMLSKEEPSAQIARRAGIAEATLYLIGGVPVPAVAHGGQIEAVEGVAPAVAQHPVVTSILVGMVPGTVVVEDLEGTEHLPGRG